MFNKSSEYEPLIETNNPFYNELKQTKDEKKSRRFPYKSIIFITVLIAIGVCVYALSGQTNDPSGISSMSSKSYNFVQAEQTHQHAGHVPKSWDEKEECTDEHPFILTMALKQQNTESLHEHVAAVSHPRNTDTFHKYWSPEKVRTYFKPSDEALNSVTDWLKENGFTKDNGKIDMVSQYGNVLRVSLTCGQANKLLNTKYMFYENTKNGKRHLRVKDGIYNIPDTVHEHIDFMSPTIRFPLERHTLKVQTMSASKLDMVRSHTKDSLVKAKKTDNNSFKKDEDEDAEEDSDDIPNIPSKIYELYGMDTDTMTSILGDEDEVENMDSTCARQAIASFIEQYYSDDDINLFWEDLDVYPESTMCRVPETQPQGFGSEAELDTQYITSTGKGIYTYVYYIDSDDIFVSLAEAILDTEIPPLVVSISYGADEYELGQDWVTRCNEEFGKLALIGTTVLASSGDSGIRGNDDDCLYGDATSVFEGEEVNGNPGKGKRNTDRGNNKRHLLEEKTNVGKVGRSGRSDKGASNKGKTSASSADTYTFVASFPASAPYVTAVGGTEGGTVQTDISQSTGETAWLYSGGGFSIYFDTPEWQQDAVSNYLDNCDTLPDDDRYVSTGRAYPDISAQSVDYVIAYDSSFYLVSGTSASSPTVAGMISMINYARIKDGKQALGFLNPSLYALYDDDQSTYFNDVIEGYNIGCEIDDNVGFYAAEGWDPITGVGTPKFSQIYQALLELD